MMPSIVFAANSEAAYLEGVGFINRTGFVDLFANKPHLGPSIKVKEKLSPRPKGGVQAGGLY